MGWLYVGIGGFIGSVLRYLVGLALPPVNGFPAATFTVNILGSLVLGFLAALSLNGILPDGDMSLLLRVGVCGGFTTFSTFALESSGMLTDGDYRTAFTYMVASLALCIAAIFAGGWLAITVSSAS